jgi:hypothetical protein
MEEECGNQDKSLEILMESLQFKPLNENLFVKVVRIEEKKNIQNIRALIKDI